MDNSSDQLWQQELSSIYLKLSLEIDVDFSERDESKFIIDSMEACYDAEFKKIESKILVRDINVLNLSFVKLIHYCNKNYNYKNITKLFLSYCDYFDLDYHQVFSNLHEKLQELIKRGFIKMIGGIKNFNRLKNKYNPENAFTLFDLIR